MADEVVLKSKEMKYRGVPLEQLKQLDAREVAKYLPSRSRRTVLRNFQKIENFIKRCETSASTNKKIKTHLRDIIILPKIVGMRIGIHNGKAFNDITILPEMLGHRLGEFAFTRSRVNHGTAGLGATKSSKSQKK